MDQTQSWLWVRIACSVACAGLILGGCGDDEPAASQDSGSPDGGGEDAGPDGGPSSAVLSIATFNAGLLDTVGFVPERQPLVNDALAALDSDVLCVQEFWLDEHWDALVTATADERPHVQRLAPMPGVSGDCSPEELPPLRECSEMMCPGAGPSDLFSCTLEMCPAEVATLSSSCTSCLLDNGASGDLDIIEEACLGAGGGAMLPVPPEDRAYFLGGSFGIGLLSKLPLSNKDTKVLDSSTTRRGILYATIEVPELGEVAVFCTHLSAILNGIRYEGSFDTWEGENAAHVQELIDWVDEKTDADTQVIVLGDLNTSPAMPTDGIVAEAADNYALLPEAGYAAPFLEGAGASCTFCSDNPLVISGDTGSGAAIDHIMVRGFDADVTSNVTATRILDELVSITSDDDGGVPDELTLSDHFGVEATFFE